MGVYKINDDLFRGGSCYDFDVHKLRENQARGCLSLQIFC